MCEHARLTLCALCLVAVCVVVCAWALVLLVAVAVVGMGVGGGGFGCCGGVSAWVCVVIGVRIVLYMRVVARNHSLIVRIIIRVLIELPITRKCVGNGDHDAT